MQWRRGKAYSQDLRERVFALCDAGDAVGEIADALCVSVSYVSKALSRWRVSRDNQNRVAATISDTSIGGISLRWAAGCQVRSRHRRWPERPDFTGGCPPQMLGRRCYLKLNILIPAVAV